MGEKFGTKRRLFNEVKTRKKKYRVKVDRIRGRSKLKGRWNEGIESLFSGRDLALKIGVSGKWFCIAET